MDIKPKSYKRKQYLIAKKFQFKYVGQILLLMFLTAALCAYVVYYTTMIFMGEKLASVYPQGRIVSIVNLVNLRILLSVVLISPLVALIAIFLSHRIAGPIFRMEKSMNEIVGGNLTVKIVLRKKDELKTLANGINNLTETFRAKVMAEKARLVKISQDMQEIKSLASSKAGDPAKTIKAVTELNNELKEMEIELAKYKV